MYLRRFTNSSMCLSYDTRNKIYLLEGKTANYLNTVPLIMTCFFVSKPSHEIKSVTSIMKFKKMINNL